MTVSPLTWFPGDDVCLSSKGFRLLDRERRNGQSWGRWNVVKVGQGLFTSSFVESGLYDWFNALLMAPTAHTLGYLALAVKPLLIITTIISTCIRGLASALSCVGRKMASNLFGMRAVSCCAVPVHRDDLRGAVPGACTGPVVPAEPRHLPRRLLLLARNHGEQTLHLPHVHSPIHLSGHIFTHPYSPSEPSRGPCVLKHLGCIHGRLLRANHTDLALCHSCLSLGHRWLWRLGRFLRRVCGPGGRHHTAGTSFRPSSHSLTQHTQF